MDDDRLAAKFDAAIEAVAEVRGEIAEERNARERQITTAKAAITLAIAAAVVGGLVNFWLILSVWQQSDQIVADRTTGRVVACERENASKADTKAGFDLLITMLGGLDEQTPEHRAFVEDFRRRFFAELPTLAPRDCSPEAVDRAARG